MVKFSFSLLAALALTTPALAATFTGNTGYALAADGKSIIIFNDLGFASDQSTITLSGASLDALAYRPVTGELYGFSNGRGGSADAVFVVDTKTGKLANVAPAFGADTDIEDSTTIGFDFNNAIDAARLVSTDDDKLVFFPATFTGRENTVTRFTDLFYAMGDVNDGHDPMIFANAYTNAVDGRVSNAGTVQFALDAGTNSLVTLANNTGVLTTVGQLTLGGSVLDFDALGGFDILSDVEGDNRALALLNFGPTSGLYSIDLATGATTLFQDLGNTNFRGFAAQTETVSAVPLPSSSLLLLAGIGGFSLMRRRKAQIV
jgi:hypothetical protein